MLCRVGCQSWTANHGQVPPRRLNHARAYWQEARSASFRLSPIPRARCPLWSGRREEFALGGELGGEEGVVEDPGPPGGVDVPEVAAVPEALEAVVVSQGDPAPQARQPSRLQLLEESAGV